MLRAVWCAPQAAHVLCGSSSSRRTLVVVAHEPAEALHVAVHHLAHDWRLLLRRQPQLVLHSVQVAIRPVGMAADIVPYGSKE